MNVTRISTIKFLISHCQLQGLFSNAIGNDNNESHLDSLAVLKLVAVLKLELVAVLKLLIYIIEGTNINWLHY